MTATGSTFVNACFGGDGGGVHVLFNTVLDKDYSLMLKKEGIGN